MYFKWCVEKAAHHLYYNVKIIINIIEKENMPKHILSFIAIKHEYYFMPKDFLLCLGRASL